MKRTLTQTISGLLAFTLPFTAIAATLQVDNSIAGLGLDVSLHDAPASSDVSIVVKDPEGGSSTVPARTDATGKAMVNVAGTKTEAAGQYILSAVGSDRKALASATVEVEADTMDPWTSTIQSWTPHIEADGHDEAEISVTLRDRYGNVLSGRPVAVISNRPDDYVEALTPQTDSSGVQHFTVTTEEPGLIQLRAVDLLSGNTIIESAEIDAESYGMGGHLEEEPSTYTTGGKVFYNAQVTGGSSFGILDRIEVTAPDTLTTNEEASKITIRAIDRSGNTIENYNGTVRFKTTDPEATVPNFGEYTFKERDLGVKTFALALKFRTPGEQTLRVEDVNDSRIFGEALIDVSGEGGSGAGQIRITSHQNDDYVNTLDIRLEGIGPRFANLIVMGGKADAFGATSDDGSFAIDVSLNPGQRDYTLRIRDDAGRYDSGSLHLILDQVKPVIGNISFVPEDPEEGDKVLVVIESEPNLGSAFMRLPNAVNLMEEELVLAPNPTQSGSYQAFFDAPAAGIYQPSITVMDKAGNVEEVRAELGVGGKSLPQVQNVKAQPRVDAVELTWDAVAGDVSGYRIYVGNDPSDFYSLNTDRAVTKATVKGLTPGKIYYFAVTAVRGEIESAEKSELVQAQVLGFKLEVTPENQALHVTWTTLTTDLPLSSFLLEYGVKEDALGETRMLNGELRDFTIRDLLSGVKYFMRITPITVTGDKLEELAADGEGTPIGNGFNPSARDDVPFDITTLPGDTLHPAPENPSTGIPAFAWMLAVAFGMAGVAYRVHRRRSVQQTAAFLQAVQSRYHS